MSTIPFEIDASVAEHFNDVRVGGFTATGLRAHPLTAEHAAAAWAEAASALKAGGVTLQNLVDRPEITGWRTASAAAGLKASRFKSSPEQLGRRTLKGKSISSPLQAVNTYCAISAQFLAPLGAYDVDRLGGEALRLRFADPEHDRFSPLGGKSSDMPLNNKTVVYALNNEIACWNWNHRDSRKTCLLENTDKLIVLGEAALAAQHAPVEKALSSLRTLFSKAGLEVGPIVWATANSRRFELSF